MDELKVDASRQGLAQTGIFVRAKVGDRWGSHDIAELEPASLLTWLRSRGGFNPYAENVVGLLLGYERLTEDESK